MRLIDADVVARAFDPLTLVNALREAHRSGGMGEVERMSVEEPGTANAALTWLAWHPAWGVAVKTATIFPGNASSGSGPNIQSVVILFDRDRGTPLAAIHGESFTRMKTAANSALPRTSWPETVPQRWPSSAPEAKRRPISAFSTLSDPPFAGS